MKKITSIICFLLITQFAWTQKMRSIQEFGVKPENSAALNKENLQKAIDWASPLGAALWI